MDQQHPVLDEVVATAALETVARILARYHAMLLANGIERPLADMLVLQANAQFTGAVPQ